MVAVTLPSPAACNSFLAAVRQWRQHSLPGWQGQVPTRSLQPEATGIDSESQGRPGGWCY